MDRAGQMRTGAVTGMLAALAYGLAGEWVFLQWNDLLIGTLSISFLILVPVVLGGLTVAFAPESQKESWPYAVFAPWVVCFVLGVGVGLLAMEAWVCITMALPLCFVLSSLGGAAMRWWIVRRRDRQLLSILLFVPFLLAPVEAQWQPPTTTRRVTVAIDVAAAPETVWNAIIAVPEIQPGEGGFAWFRWMGLPQPRAATLSEPGPAGMRYANYANGFQVIEPVQLWEPHHRYRFDVELDPASHQPTPLWAAVAGRAVDVEWVEYTLEPRGPNQLRLHLTSQYALTTPVNPYAGVWLDFILQDFQAYILRVVGGRAEAIQLAAR